MPVEYYLGAAVAVIVLVLLVSAFTGKKKSRRRVGPVSHASTEDLTRQLARAADALEAILAHLNAHPVQTPAAQQTPVRPATPQRVAQGPAPAQPPATVPAALPVERSADLASSQTIAFEHVVPAADPAIAGTPAGEPGIAAEAAESAPEPAPKPRRVKLSMFGR